MPITPTRSHYLPSKKSLQMMSDQDREWLLEGHLRDTAIEMAGLKSGEIMAWDGTTKAHHLKLVRARKRRVIEAAKEFGLDLSGLSKQ